MNETSKPVIGIISPCYNEEQAIDETVNQLCQLLKKMQTNNLISDKSFVGFVDDLEKLGQRLDQAQTSYHDAFNKLKTGKGNLIRTAEKVRELGVKPSKNLAAPLLESSSDFE